MKNTLFGILVLCGLVGIAISRIAMANGAVDGDQPAMMVSPNVIVLAKVSTVTVHTNIAAVAVDLSSVGLNGVVPTSVGVDNLGHLVAKFAVEDLDLARGRTTLTLTGAFKEGGTFSATDVVTVK